MCHKLVVAEICAEAKRIKESFAATPGTSQVVLTEAFTIKVGEFYISHIISIGNIVTS